MQDLLMIAALTAFFALAVVFVKACERIIGPDIDAARLDADLPAAAEEEAAA